MMVNLLCNHVLSISLYPQHTQEPGNCNMFISPKNELLCSLEYDGEK